MLHPFTPYVTEELWGHLKRAAQAHPGLYAPQGGWEDALIIARWPQAAPLESWEEQKMADFSLVMDVVRAIRNIRAEKKVQPGKRISATLVAGDRLNILQAQASSIIALAYLDPVTIKLVGKLDKKPREGTASMIVSGVEIFLPLADLVDIDQERARLQIELADIQKEIERLKQLLGSDFARRAPVPVVEKERQKLVTYQDTAQKLREQLKGL
jgi:valyl-tRNA synthetase